jgi:hypothetical protein
MAAKINSLAIWTGIGPMIVPTTNPKVVMSSLSAMELTHGSWEIIISSVCKLLKPSTLAAPSAPVIQIGCFRSTEICIT